MIEHWKKEIFFARFAYNLEQIISTLKDLDRIDREKGTKLEASLNPVILQYQIDSLRSDIEDCRMLVKHKEDFIETSFLIACAVCNRLHTASYRQSLSGEHFGRAAIDLGESFDVSWQEEKRRIAVSYRLRELKQQELSEKVDINGFVEHQDESGITRYFVRCPHPDCSKILNFRRMLDCDTHCLCKNAHLRVEFRDWQPRVYYKGSWYTFLRDQKS